MDAAEVADAWWERLPSRRRVQVHDWIEGKPAVPPELPGQTDLLGLMKEGEER